MATIRDLLDLMQLANNELRTGEGLADEARSITALLASQRLMESVAATFPKTMQSASEIATTATVETTALSANVLRIDGIQPLDASGGQPNADLLDSLSAPGSHIPAGIWPLFASTQVPGRPDGYVASQGKTLITIYWNRIPDSVYYFRLYGFTRAAAFAGRDDAFEYADAMLMPIAALAVKLLMIGVGDDDAQMFALAQEHFSPALRAQRHLDRSRPITRHYMRPHDT